MKFETITIKDIAKALGLSTSTVSRALRGGYEISEETKRIVLEYAEKINYRPNPIALSLKERRSHSIGVIVCEIANNFFSQVINGIESVAYKSGYHVIITQSNESFEREALNVNHLASRSVDGLLISLSSETSDISYLKALHDKGLPIVLFDRVSEEINTHKVITDNFQGGFAATEYLINRGHRKIAHFTNAAHLSVTRERLLGYKAALEKHNIAYNGSYVKFCNHGGMIQNELDDAVNDLLSMKDRPEAIFIGQDKLTTGALLAFKKLDPEYASKIDITGFTNSNVVDLISPSIIAVRQPAFEMGQAATELLIQLIESKYPVTDFETRVMNTQLMVK
ncbi:MAG: LacI family DNA-binding transcriptional regulator [Sphingobacteriaceae bacterium]